MGTDQTGVEVPGGIVNYPTERSSLAEFLSQRLARIAGLGESAADWTDYHHINRALRLRVLRIGGGRVDVDAAERIVEQAVCECLPELHMRHQRHRHSHVRTIAEQLVDKLNDEVIDHLRGSGTINDHHSTGETQAGDDADIVRRLFGAGATPTSYEATLLKMRSADLHQEYIVVTKYITLVEAAGSRPVRDSDVVSALQRSGVYVTNDDVRTAKLRFLNLMNQ